MIQAGLPNGVTATMIMNENHYCSIVTFKPSSSNMLSSRIAITGRAKVLALEGCVDIFGYTLSSESNTSVIVDSPSWMSTLCISPQVITGQDAKLAATSVTKIKVISMESDSFTFELSSLMSVRSPIFIDDRWVTASNDIINGMIVGDNLHNNAQSQTNTILMKNNRIFVCGAKNVGKSTFVRYLINRILSSKHHDKVALLDCDAGQPELSPPGMLSLTVVANPLLCPPHVHMICGNDGNVEEEESKDVPVYAAAKEHHRAFYYGSTTSKTNPNLYIDIVKNLTMSYDELCQNINKDIPIIINTDGWVKGLGYEILSSIIDIVNPGHIVQLLGSTKAKFFDISSHATTKRKIHVVFAQSGTLSPAIEMGAISRETSSASLQLLSQEENKSDSVSLTSMTKESNLPIQASSLRALRLSVYFLQGYNSFLRTGATFQQSGIIDDDCNIASQLAKMRPYAVSFDALSCIVLIDEDGQNKRITANSNSDDVNTVYDLINGNVVGLCSDIDDSLLYPCIGLGIVRSIDHERKIFYVLTPHCVEILQTKVTTMVHAQLQIPLQMVFRGHNSEAFPFQSCHGVTVGIGSEVMKSKGLPSRR